MKTKTIANKLKEILDNMSQEEFDEEWKKITDLNLEGHSMIEHQEPLEKYQEALKQFPEYDQYLERIGFESGAQWQQERSYSEKDMIEFGFSTYCYISELMGVPFNLISENRLNAELWFEQFKKK